MRTVYIILLSFLSVSGFTQNTNLDLETNNNYLYNDTLHSKTRDTTYNLNEIVISALRTPTKLLKTADAISIITNKNINRLQARTTPELLFNQNAVFLQKTNHGGGSPFLRGLTGNQTLHLVDGIRLNNATFRYGPNQYLNTIDPFTLEKVEILRGAGQ
jgi:hemoglobin/transferrin/lactoferrin receptor protein